MANRGAVWPPAGHLNQAMYSLTSEHSDFSLQSRDLLPRQQHSHFDLLYGRQQVIFIEPMYSKLFS